MSQYKQKLNIRTGQYNLVPTQLADLVEDSTHRLVTDDEKSTWNDISTVALNVILNAFRIAQIGSLTIFSMVKGILDEYENESGIDLINSVNQSYDSVGKFYTPLSTPGAYGSDVFTGGVASASSYYTGGPVLSPDLAFDHDYNSEYGTFWAATGILPQWLKYDLGVGVTKKIQQITIIARNNDYGSNPKSFQFQGSNDDSVWDTLLTITNKTHSDWNLEVQSFQFTNNVAYRYYRLYITETYGTSPQIRELEGMEYIPGEVFNMDLRSNSQTTSVIPSEARVVIFEEDIDDIILNTDLKAYVSRNAGTTWTQVILEDEGNYIAGARVVSGSINISSQSSVSSLKYKIETLNAKLLKIHGIAVSYK